jgi:hypothetical protein
MLAVPHSLETAAQEEYNLFRFRPFISKMLTEHIESVDFDPQRNAAFRVHSCCP